MGITPQTRKPRCIRVVKKGDKDRTCLRVVNRIHPDYPGFGICTGCCKELEIAKQKRVGPPPPCLHKFYQIINVNQGWETGTGKCANCGTSLPLEFEKTKSGDIGGVRRSLMTAEEASAYTRSITGDEE